MSSAFRVLIVSPNWVGDAVMAQVVVQGIRQAHPQSIIDILTPLSCADVWHRAPGVHSVLIDTFRHGALQFLTRWRWAQKLRGHYKQAIILPNSLKSALIPWMAGISCRTGYTGESRYGVLNDRRNLDVVRYPRWIDRCYALASSALPSTALQAPVPQLVAHEVQHALMTRLGLTLNKPVVALCTGAEFGSAKQWPLHHWLSLAERFHSQGFDVWMMGGPKDRQDGESLAQAVPGVHSLCGQTTLGEAIDLMACTQIVIANDSGLLHVAAALGLPSVGLYGSTPSDYAPPVSRWPGQTQILEIDLECRPCRQRVCPLGHRRCLEDITSDQVWAAAHTVLHNKEAVYKSAGSPHAVLA